MKMVSKIPEDFILVTTDRHFSYCYRTLPEYTHRENFEACREKLQEKPLSKIPSNELMKIAESVLKNNLIEFHDKIKQQISRSAIGTKFVPHMHVFTWIKQKEILLRSKIFSHSYVNDIFFIWTHEKFIKYVYGKT